ncbi:Pyk [Desulforapulum autotrophicum HRM2]|uniref:Pyruvate kinase n=1 Tax=Desulforapulum autotrophicum (strain ATCC 43914 / DSM 3382 / VKM B-1955 / HRM2) TaxID=177437 RepID=C0QGT8_DESAH|nr:pyruvate kinase [Desulforapulum autotrophicum]ACN15587.1 Pyk [Desulforapulum autotrophicum HRM2]
MRRKTKIVATISDRNCEPEFLKQLYDAGMDVVRLNTAHQTHEDALKVIENVRKVSNKIAILIDTKGPEIRTCGADTPLTVAYGDFIQIKGAPDERSAGNIIYVSYPGFVNDVPVGTTILIDDGSIALTVKERNSDFLTCFVENDGIIYGRKSVNIPAVHVKLPALSEKDKGFIRFAADNHVDFIAHSFVRHREDVLAVQRILDERKSTIKIIAKIENSGGVENIDEILEVAYGIMIARGDLAVEIPAEKIPLVQKALVRRCIEKRAPVIVATQMLHSMMTSPRPTRAEVSDVANACLDSTDALMLSGETASGKYPLLAVQTMAKIANEVETNRSTYINTPYTLENKITGYLAKSAVKASMRLNTEAIVADSITGTTIRAIAAYRGDNPIYAQTYDEKVMRELALSFGVHADTIQREEATTIPIRKAILRLIEQGILKEDTLITVLAGHFGSDHGASYIEISTAKRMMARGC